MPKKIEKIHKVKKIFQSPKGTFDILPLDQIYWDFVKKIAREFADFYRFEKLDTPILEEQDLFLATLGKATDVVEKQMYSFKTKGGDSLVMRPEGTASIIRAYLSNGMMNLPHPIKIFYEGPMFRYEKPQANRFRQFHQFGFENIGETSAVADAQIINLLYIIFGKLKIKPMTISINSVGCPECRPFYKSKLLAYYKTVYRDLCKDCKRRYYVNPLRLLDCKEENCKALKESAPHLMDQLCPNCHGHFKSLLEFLDELALPYILNPYLVRGLDYYTKTVFEIYFEEQGDDGVGSSDALAGGGRYDNLVEMLGGRPTPAVGASVGFERVINILKKINVKLPNIAAPQVFIVQLGDLARKKSVRLFEDLRNSGIRVAESFGRDSIKSQLHYADKLEAAISLILGQKEVMDETVILREMETGLQEIVPMDKIILIIKKRLQKLKKHKV